MCNFGDHHFKIINKYFKYKIWLSGTQEKFYFEGKFNSGFRYYVSEFFSITLIFSRYYHSLKIYAKKIHMTEYLVY